MDIGPPQAQQLALPHARQERQDEQFLQAMPLAGGEEAHRLVRLPGAPLEV
jgi:hypothetical protein